MFDKRTLRRDNGGSFGPAIAQWRGALAAREQGGSAQPMRDGGRTAEVGWLRVYVRKRPLFEAEVGAAEFDVVSVHGGAVLPSAEAGGAREQQGLSPDACSQVSVHLCLHRPDLKRMHMRSVTFSPTAAFGERASSELVFAHAAAGLVRQALSGGVGTLFSFGQTGSGKTHTCSAIEALAAAHIFAGLASAAAAAAAAPAPADGRSGAGGGVAGGALGRRGTGPPAQGAQQQAQWVSLSFVELRGRHIGDLLAPDPPPGGGGGGGGEVVLRDNGQGQVALVGATRRRVHSAAELSAAIALGKSRRATEETAANATSSRSHALLLLELPPSAGGEGGRLVLVDCAGTERKEDSAHHSADRRREGAEINASLHALKECLRAIAAAETAASSAAAAGERAPRAVHVPYRASLLTRVLSDSFTHPRAVVAVLATVSPGCTATEHTLHTLQTVTAMCSLDGLTREESIDVEAAQLFPPPPQPPKEWSHEALAHWMGSLRAGRFRAQALALAPELDGKRLCRMPATYFSMVLCAGNEALGSQLYADLHAEMESASRLKHEHVKAMRNARSAVKGR